MKNLFKFNLALFSLLFAFVSCNDSDDSNNGQNLRLHPETGAVAFTEGI